MKLDASDIAELRPLIDAAVQSTLDKIQADEAKLAARIGYIEPEAAALMGVQSHVLRDCRLRGEISGRLVGKRIVYSRDALLRFLADDRGAR